MWIFTCYGFFSIACASHQNGTIDPDTVMVRARSKKHLLNLKDRFPVLANQSVLNWPNRDYRYRLIIPKSDWVAILSAMAEEQTWSNFKSEAARRGGQVGPAYTSALHDVWSRMYRLQPAEERRSSSSVRRTEI